MRPSLPWWSELRWPIVMRGTLKDDRVAAEVVAEDVAKLQRVIDSLSFWE